MQRASLSCLQKVQAHGSCCIFSNSSICFFCRRDFSSTYNQRQTSGIPNAKKMIIVRIGTRKTNKDNPKSTVPMPRDTSHLFVNLSIDKSKSSPHSYLMYGGSSSCSCCFPLSSVSSTTPIPSLAFFLFFRSFLTSASISRS